MRDGDWLTALEAGVHGSGAGWGETGGARFPACGGAAACLFSARRSERVSVRSHEDRNAPGSGFHPAGLIGPQIRP